MLDYTDLQLVNGLGLKVKDHNRLVKAYLNPSITTILVTPEIKK